MQIRSLGGHSGCKILLCEENDNHVFVRKISSGWNYNDRLKAQANKQEHFQSRFVKAPQVLCSGLTDEGLYYFDMEYVRGITLAEYMKSIEVGKIRGLVDVIMQNIVSMGSAEKGADESVFLAKIHSLRSDLVSLSDPVIEKALDVLESHSWNNFGRSACHGDLTLQNIIVKDDQLYFIDFLDSFYECWLLDIGTLMQDVHAMWSYRYWRKIDMNTLIRLIVFRDVLLDEVETLDPENVSEVFYALLLKLLRIYPYTKDSKTRQFLDEKTASVLSVIEKGDFRK